MLGMFPYGIICGKTLQISLCNLERTMTEQIFQIENVSAETQEGDSKGMSEFMRVNLYSSGTGQTLKHNLNTGFGKGLPVSLYEQAIALIAAKKG
jgi:hypothetical protein